MTMVSEYSWESNTWTNHGDNPARTAWREAVAASAANAKQAFPTSKGRVDSAVKIVLAGDVVLLPDGKAKVASQSNGTFAYFVVNGECTCKDAPKAPKGWCKHRFAYGIHKRAMRLAKETLDRMNAAEATGVAPVAPAPVAPVPLAPVCQDIENTPAPELVCPEAHFSLNLKVRVDGREGQVTVRGQSVQQFTGNLQAMRELLQSLEMSDTKADTAPPAPEGHSCPTHGLMNPSTKAPGTYFCPVKLADGSYCKSRWPQA
jgi:hypothetical protein